MNEQKSFINRLMTETWPARMAQDALKALMLPGDVYQGKVSMYGDDGRTNPEVINRSADLAGLVTLGAGGVPAEANSLRAGIKAYHGSPHDFDRFDMGKIGTGEGAQAYGHGLYFAENEATAKAYRDGLGHRNIVIDGRTIKPTNQAEVLAANELADHGFDLPNTISSIGEYVGSGRASKAHDEALSVLNDWLRAGAKTSSGGHMYEVNINADPAHFLDWDKPLSGQSGGVRAALENLGIKYDAKGDKAYTNALLDALTGDANRALPKEVSNPLGSELYRRSGSVFQSSSDPMRSAAFREAGIPGIKYLDQGSRTAGDGSRNYVVFDDKLIDILRKYGLAGATASPLAALMYGHGQGEFQQ